MGPTLSSPANGATAQRLDLAFAWATVAGADGYQVQVSRDAAFSVLDLDTAASIAALNLSDLVAAHGYPLDFNTLYFWRVRSRQGQAFSDWSDASEFTTEAAALAFDPILDHEDRAKGLLLQQFRGGI